MYGLLPSKGLRAHFTNKWPLIAVDRSKVTPKFVLPNEGATTGIADVLGLGVGNFMFG